MQDPVERCDVECGGLNRRGADGNANTFVSVVFNPNLARSCGSTGTVECGANNAPLFLGAASLTIDGDTNTVSATDYGTVRLPYIVS